MRSRAIARYVWDFCGSEYHVLRFSLGLALILWGGENLLELYRFGRGPFAVIAGKGPWIALGVGQVLAGLCALLGYYTRVPALLLAVLAVLTMLIPETVVLGATPLLAFGCAMLGGAIALFLVGGAAQDGQTVVLEGKSG